MPPETRLEKLKALEEELRKGIETCETKELAALARQYRETLKEIEEIEGAEADGDEITELLSNRESAGKPGAVRPSMS